jgi:hypothetical protein
MPPHQREGKQHVACEGKVEEEMELQSAKRAIKVVYGHSDSESSDNEHCKKLHVMYGSSWDITSRRIVKTLCQAVATVAPSRERHPTTSGWRRQSRSMPLIDGGAALNLISLATFQKL